MIIFDNLVALVDTAELQSFRMHNSASSASPTAGAKGLMRFLTTNDRPNYWNGSAWLRFSSLLKSSSAFPDIALTQNYILIGNSSAEAQEYPTTQLTLNAWGAPTAALSIGNQRLTNVADPTAATDGTNKQYVDGLAQGIDGKDSCLIGSNQALPACTYSNSSGTIRLTADSNAVALTAAQVDSTTSATLGVNSRMMVKNQAVSAQNGLYFVVQLGSAGVSTWILERTLDANTNTELMGAYTFIEQGLYAGTGWLMNQITYDITLTPPTGTVSWTQFSGAGAYTGNRGIVLNGTQINFCKDSNYAIGDLFYADSTTSVAALAAGSAGRVLYSSGSGAAPAWSVYALPIGALLANQIMYSYSTGEVRGLASANSGVLVTSGAGVPSIATDIPTAVTIGGAYVYRVGGTDILAIDGGTGIGSYTVGDLLYADTTTTLAKLAASAAGYVLQSAGASSAPAWFNLFGTLNTWTSAQYISTTWVSSAVHEGLRVINFVAPGVGEMRYSPAINFISQGNAGGTTWSAGYRVYNKLSVVNAYSKLVIEHTLSSGAASYTEKFAFDGDSGGFEQSGTTIIFARNATPTGTLSWTPTTSAKTLTLPDVTDTLVARTTTDTLTNKTMSTGSSWAGTNIPTQYGGTGQNFSATAQYSLPYFSATGVVGVIAPTASRILTTDGSSVPSWGGVLNVDRNTSGGIMRKWSNLVAGDNANAYITVTHSLNTRDVIVSVRQSNSGDTGEQEIGGTKVTVVDANTVRVHFGGVVQTSSTYYVVTVAG